ncbi:MAG: endolytic transglycosylase MltG [Neomegalonema sp.]|nr:endolytic transglycosylase MltG [Neomegalonema sp.]
MRSRSVSFWSSLFTIAIVVMIGLNFWLGVLQQRFHEPGPLGAERVITVPQGAGLSSIANTLEKNGVISSAWLFSANARRKGLSSALKAGEFVVPASASMNDVLGLITEGRAVQHRITVPEGYTAHQVVDLLEANEILTGEIESVPAEGSLAPDTYFVHRGDTRAALIERMQTAQNEIIDGLWETRNQDLPIKTKQEALILASIVEKETGYKMERGLVASVFYNRLNKGMKLQTDPTIVYGITLGDHPVNGLPLGRPISKKDRDTPTEHNTYHIDGLPPTPIANPGRASLAAVLNPPTSDYFFFVTDCSQGHVFSKTGREHLRHVANLRRCEKQQRNAGGN